MIILSFLSGPWLRSSSATHARAPRTDAEVGCLSLLLELRNSAPGAPGSATNFQDDYYEFTDLVAQGPGYLCRIWQAILNTSAI